MKAIVVAMDKNRGIGAANDLPWQQHLPADLAHFKQLTTGGTVIMGRKTFESIGHPLLGRRNVVLSHNSEIQDVIIAKSLPEAYNLAWADQDIFIIGGGQIYNQALNDMNRLYVTEVQAEFSEATVFFPKIDPTKWHETSRTHNPADEDNKYPFDFVIYDRV